MVYYIKALFWDSYPLQNKDEQRIEIMRKACYGKESRKKIGLFFNGPATKALPPPPRAYWPQQNFQIFF